MVNYQHIDVNENSNRVSSRQYHYIFKIASAWNATPQLARDARLIGYAIDIIGNLDLEDRNWHDLY